MASVVDRTTHSATAVNPAAPSVLCMQCASLALLAKYINYNLTGQWSIIADLSPEMAGFAAQRIEAAGLSDRVSARQADMQDLSAWQAR